MASGALSIETYPLSGNHRPALFLGSLGSTTADDHSIKVIKWPRSGPYWDGRLGDRDVDVDGSGMEMDPRGVFVRIARDDGGGELMEIYGRPYTQAPTRGVGTGPEFVKSSRGDATLIDILGS